MQIPAAHPSPKNPQIVALFQHTLAAQLSAWVHTSQQHGYPQCQLWAQDESRWGLLLSCVIGLRCVECSRCCR